MIQNNKLDQSFGPIGTISGITIFLVGIILVFFSLSGLLLILIGAFVGFSSSSTIIDFDKKRVRFSNNLFGIIKTGRWISIEPTMKLGIEKSNRAWRAYSRGSRSIDITDKDFRVILFDGDSKPIMPLMKTVSLELAKEECNNLAVQLGIKRVE